MSACVTDACLASASPLSAPVASASASPSSIAPRLPALVALPPSVLAHARTHTPLQLLHPTQVLDGTKDSTADDFVSFGEFRLLNAYLCIYATMVSIANAVTQE